MAANPYDQGTTSLPLEMATRSRNSTSIREKRHETTIRFDNALDPLKRNLEDQIEKNGDLNPRDAKQRDSVSNANNLHCLNATPTQDARNTRSGLVDFRTCF
jgi:hypothetical protein